MASTLVVETGTGSSTADSHETIANVNTYALARGDTLKLNGVTYRLWSINAPETK